MSKSKILVGLTGSIACYKTCTLISRLVQDGCDVQVVATPSALKFVGEATLEGLTGQKVFSDTFERGQMMSHIDLARWADAFVIAPLSAGHLGKMASGIADDLLTTLYLAYERTKPLFVAPAMNSVMWSHPAVMDNLRRLENIGAKILDPAEGRLACGETGPGKMMEPEDILRELRLELSTTKPKRGRVLVVYGGTREPIDGVRSITNTSTGATGAALADELWRLGFEVKALASETAVLPNFVRVERNFESAKDLQNELRDILSHENFDSVVQLAAVSDFKVDVILRDGESVLPDRTIKLGSEKSISIKLGLNPKVVQGIKGMTDGMKPVVVAFKLTNSRDLCERDRAIRRLLESPGVDYVVHNDLHEIDKANGRHEFRVYSRSGREIPCQGVLRLAEVLAPILERKTPSRKSKFEVIHDSLS